MIGSLSAEFLKLRKRWSIWICAAILIAILVTLGYAVGYLLLSHPPPGSQFPPGFDIKDAKKVYYPDHLINNTLNGLPTFGGALALVIGVLSMGSEFGWSTLKTVFTQRPGRLVTLAARLVVLAALLLVLSVACFAAAAASSLAAATLDGADYSWPAPFDLARAVLSAWLVFCLWCSFGVFLSILFRQSALAIGIGLVYMLIVEGLIFGILGSVGGEVARNIERFFPGPNASALAQSFGNVRLRGIRNPPNRPLASGTQAALVLLAYGAAFSALAGFFLRRRDVT